VEPGQVIHVFESSFLLTVSHGACYP
jgi:hypothetical protein